MSTTPATSERHYPWDGLLQKGRIVKNPGLLPNTLLTQSGRIGLWKREDAPGHVNANSTLLRSTSHVVANAKAASMEHAESVVTQRPGLSLEKSASSIASKRDSIENCDYLSTTGETLPAAPVVARQSRSSSPSTTSTGEETPIVKAWEQASISGSFRRTFRQGSKYYATTAMCLSSLEELAPTSGGYPLDQLSPLILKGSEGRGKGHITSHKPIARGDIPTRPEELTDNPIVQPAWPSTTGSDLRVIGTESTLSKARKILRPGSRGGIGYWDGNGNWHYGQRPLHPRGPRQQTTPAPTQQESPAPSPHRQRLRAALKGLLTPSNPSIEQSKQRLQQHGYIVKEDAGLLAKPTKEREQTLKNVEEAVRFVHDTIPGLSDLVKAQKLSLTINTTPVKGPDISGKYSVNPLTKKKGITIRQDAGQTFFHEIGHFIDNSLPGGQDEKILGMGLPFASQRKGSSAQKVVESLQSRRSVKTFLDEGEKKNGEMYRDYLSQEPEMFARAFNAYLDYEYAKKTGDHVAGERIGESFTPQELEGLGKQMTSLLRQAHYKSFRDFLTKSKTVQHPGSRGGHPHWNGHEWVYGKQATGASEKPQEHLGNGTVPSGPKPSSEPIGNPWVRQVAREYVRKHGIADDLPERPYVSLLPEETRKQLADAYEAARHNPKDPAVERSYAALAKEIKAQYEHALSAGMTFQPWGQHADPYKTSAEMREDVLKHKHLGFFQGGDMPADHPLAQIDPDHGLSYNDEFRAIHDLYGHAQGGYGFHARGEENAWVEHSRMFTPEARKAMTTETRMQNHWVNAGPHLRRPDGSIPNKGEHGYIAPPDRPFAEQKAFLPPEAYTHSVDTPNMTKSLREYLAQ